jgi:hypothetical protein
LDSKEKELIKVATKGGNALFVIPCWSLTINFTNSHCVAHYCIFFPWIRLLLTQLSGSSMR